METGADGAFSPSGALLRARSFQWWPTPQRPLVMGVVNASPDSFSDGGQFRTLDEQVNQAFRLVADGADIIDIGGESGVTDTPVTDAADEAARVLPLVRRLADQGICVSVDTWKPAVAGAALAAGASMINDVSGLADLGLIEACAAFDAGLVVMHTRAAPKTKVILAYDDVVDDVTQFLTQGLALAVGRGLSPANVILDPGPDFAKTPAQTVQVLRGLARLAPLGRPLLLALSRKDFVGALCGRAPRDRMAGTLAALGEGLNAGGSILRVHDVAATRDFLAVRAALRGWDPVPEDLRLADQLRRQRQPLGA